MRPFVPLIEARDLRFTIGDKTVLSGVNLLVHEGEYISVIGPNGSGKTSLLRCLVRIARHTSGRVILSGRPIESFTRRELACMVSYVPQSADSFLPFSVWEFVFSGRYAHLGPLAPAGSRDREAVERSLDLTGTTGLKDRPLATLSGGERQRVFIAAALAQESRIMLLDEPTTALDPRHAADVLGLLRRIGRERGVSIVMATHDIAAAVRSSDRILALRNGRTAFWGESRLVVENGVLEDIFESPFLRLKHPEGGADIVIADVP